MSEMAVPPSWHSLWFRALPANYIFATECLPIAYLNMTSAQMSASGQPSPDDEDQTFQQRAPKRQKIQVACAVCKSRKSKCDGVRPVCGPCSRRKRGKDAHMCHYRTEKPDHALGQQLRPESLSDSNGPKLPRDTVPMASVELVQTNSSYVHANREEHLSTEPSAFDLGTAAVSNDPAHDRPQTPSDGSASDRTVDAMGCVDSWALRSGLVGGTSGVNFASQLRALADGTDHLNYGTKGTKSEHVTTKLLRLRRKRRTRKEFFEQQLVLPPRKKADHLFEIYWTFSDVIFPWLDEQEIRKQYESLWTADGSQEMDEQVFYSILNFMFAIAAKLDPAAKPETRHKLANTFYDRARDLMSFDLLDLSHFSILQALLLATQYLQSTNMPRQCFQVLGLAIWMAQDLGLHLPETTCRLKDPRERELARRVWHGCICMDKIAAMLFGRPSRISKAVADKAVYPQRSQHFADQSTAANVSPESPAKLDFFIAYCKLHHVLGDVLQYTYDEEHELDADGRPGERAILSDGRLNQLFQIDHQLLSWHAQLPVHLRVQSDMTDRGTTAQTTRQANILHARYLYVRLLMFRTFYTRPHQSNQPSIPGASSLESEAAAVVVTQCQVRCVQAAQGIIELIACNLPISSLNSQTDVLPSWWYTISYTFTSSLVIIAASLFPSVVDIVSATTLENAVNKGYQILQHYHSYAGFARKCSSVLRSVHDKVSSQKQPDQATWLHLPKHLAPTPNSVNSNRMDTWAEDSALGSFDFDFVPGDFSWLDINSFKWSDGSWSLPASDLPTNEDWQLGSEAPMRMGT